MAKAEVVDQFQDYMWRLNNLYWIVDKDGNRVLFKPNHAQQELIDNLHFRNVILKARQLGMTTLIQILMLDQCFWNYNVQAGTIAHKLDAATEIFRTKVKYPYDNLPEQLKEANKNVSETSRTLEFRNGSKITVDTSFRSGTYQYLHISEYGKICAKDPDRAEEIRTGALNTVKAGQHIFIESTAEGRHGHFFDLTQHAKKHKGKLTPLDFKFFFFPWYDDPEYRLDDEVEVPQQTEEYFEWLENDQGIQLTPQQKAWYVKTAETQGEFMKREYPSTPKEAFEQAIEGAYFAKQLAVLRNRDQITKVPHNPKYPVHTFWDLGHRDSTAIWFYQKIGMEHRFIDFYDRSGEGLPHYVRALERRGKHNGGEPYNYGNHYLPHDADAETLAGPKTIADQLRDLGLRNIRVGDKPRHKSTAIESARTVLPMCWFDSKNCDRGLAALENYQKQWNEKDGVWRDEPVHNWASHAADAFMEFAMNQETVDKKRGAARVPRLGLA